MNTPDLPLLKQVDEATLARNLNQVQHSMASYPHAKLVAVTKSVTADTIERLAHLGVLDIAENRVQPAMQKQAQLAHLPQLRWHLIGPVQRNKVNKVVGKFQLIHSVDSVEIAQAISQAALQKGIIQPVLLQVNISNEATKHGFTAEQVTKNASQLAALKGLKVHGLMTMAPFGADEAMCCMCFGQLFTLKHMLQDTFGDLFSELSMGMSGDYAHALQQGATIIRIGSLLFKS